MTGLSHEHSEAVSFAAEWLARTPRERMSRPVVPVLRSMFGLSVSEAVDAIREAQAVRQGGADATP